MDFVSLVFFRSSFRGDLVGVPVAHPYATEHLLDRLSKLIERDGVRRVSRVMLGEDEPLAWKVLCIPDDEHVYGESATAERNYTPDDLHLPPMRDHSVPVFVVEEDGSISWCVYDPSREWNQQAWRIHRHEGCVI